MHQRPKDLDSRYTVRLEMSGPGRPRHIARFCGVYLRGHEKTGAAWDTCTEHRARFVASVERSKHVAIS